MTTPASLSWQNLLSPPGSRPTETRQFRLVQRAAEPFLLLPLKPQAAGRGLDLYPAQTRKARVLRAALRSLLRWGLSPGTQPVDLEIAVDAPVVRFVGAGKAWADLQLAMLLGNPRAPGRRFVLLIMDAQGEPLHIVKAGTDDKAEALIQKEAAFLQSHPAGRLHAPQLRGVFAGSSVSALALAYADGEPPRTATESKLGDILGGWLNPETPLTFSMLPSARRLLASDTLSSVERQLLARLEVRPIVSAIHHGDFAPWNIREEAGSGRWTVLDWERGETQGPPAWDWFHFRVQTAVLVERLRPKAILDRIESSLRDSHFQRYASAAGIIGLERELLLAYLLHARDVVRQTEGVEVIRALAEQLTARKYCG